MSLSFDRAHQELSDVQKCYFKSKKNICKKLYNFLLKMGIFIENYFGDLEVCLKMKNI